MVELNKTIKQSQQDTLLNYACAEDFDYDRDHGQNIGWGSNSKAPPSKKEYNIISEVHGGIDRRALTNILLRKIVNHDVTAGIIIDTVYSYS